MTKSTSAAADMWQAPDPNADTPTPDRSQGTRGGFTLVELMLVVAIIGVLASIAIPALWQQTLVAKRSEAYGALRAIYEAQAAHFAEHGSYCDTFDELGFELTGARRIDERTIQGAVYTYTMSALTQNGVPAANFRAMATGNLDPRDAMLDILMIENDLTVVN